jgi:hypothetical protein
MAARIIDELRGALLCGSILILAGSLFVLGVTASAFELLWQLGGSVENEQIYYIVPGFALGTIIALGLTVLGFFVVKRSGTTYWCTPTGYVVICGVFGIIPGFLLLLGWGTIAYWLAKRKDQQRAGFRDLWNSQRVAVIVAAVVLLIFLDMFVGYVRDL